MNSSIRTLAIFVFSLALLTACGETSTQTEAVAAATPTTQAPSSPIDQIVLATGEWDPYTTENKPGQGAFTEIVTAVFIEMGEQPKIIFYPWKRSEAETLDGNVFAAFPYVETEERKKEYDFSDPVFVSTGKFFYMPQKHENIEYSSLEDLRPYHVGGVLGYWYETPFKEAGLDVDYTSSDEQNVQKLYLGRIDLMATDELVGWSLINQLYPNEKALFATLEKSLNESPLRLMISRKYPNSAAILQKFNAALQRSYEKGTIQTILEKYGIKSQ